MASGESSGAVCVDENAALTKYRNWRFTDGGGSLD